MSGSESLSHTEGNRKQAKDLEDARKVILPLNNLHCADCALNIERSIEHLSGILSAEVNFVLGTATIRYDPYRVNIEKIKRAIAKPGYIVRETALERARGFWQEYRLAIFMIASGLLLLFSWLSPWLGERGSSLSVSLALSSIVLGGYPIFKSALRTLLIFDVNVDTLVSIAASAALLNGAYQEAAIVIFIMLLGEFLEKFTAGKMKRAIAALMEIAPKYAVVKHERREVEIPIEKIKVGDIVIVKPGERIPADGTIISGEGSVNQAPLTGESLPVDKKAGDRVYSGTINETGSFEMQAIQVGEDTKLAQIKRLILEAQVEKAPIQRMTDRYTRYFVPLILVISSLLYLLTKDINRSITILIVACPCALVLGTPTAVVAAIGSAAKRGILVKGGEYLEAAGYLDTLLFDKTGTLTRGYPRVAAVKGFNNFDDDQILYLASIAEKRSEHPLAKAILDKVKERSISLPDPQRFQILKGQGVIASWGSSQIIVGNRELMSSQDISWPEEVENYLREKEGEGKTVLMVALDRKICGVISIADLLRKEAKEAVKGVKKAGIRKVIMLTGDNERTAKAVAESVQVDEFFAQMLPEDKVDKVKSLKKSGSKVGMIGDGVNDAPALAAADIGIAMGVMGTDVALETADIALISDDLLKVAQIMSLSRKTISVIKQNLVFALLFNLAMIILAGGGGLSMIMGAVMHQISSLGVILNSMRLLRAIR